MRTTLVIADPACKEHLTGFGHPERPERFDAVWTGLVQAKLANEQNWHKPRLALEEELQLCHSQAYVELVRRECAEARGVTELSTGDVMICPASYREALRSAGAVLTGIDLVMGKKGDNCFVLTRPPGHHACRERGMGFCLFNNVAIGARYAQKAFGCGPVLIVDWDVHHGNGTQEIFEEDPSFFYFSTHQGNIYPGTGRADDVGLGAAEGTKLNVPIMPSLDAREQILVAFEERLIPAMETFKPELVLISCGFDAHVLDPLGQLNLEDEDFATLTRLVLSIADRYAEGRVISVLEGGYSLSALATASVAHVQALRS